MARDNPGQADELLSRTIQLIQLTREEIRSSSAILAETRERVEQTQRRLDTTERLIHQMMVFSFDPRS